MKWKFPTGLDGAQSLIFKAKLIPSCAEQLGGELENQISCFIKDKHSVWKHPARHSKAEGALFNVNIQVI